MADKGLKRSVADIFPDAIHLPCCFHLLQNAKKKGAVDVALFWWVQASPSVAEFELRMEKLAQKSHGNAVEYLAIANVHPLLWVEFKNHMFATDLVSHI